MQFIEPTVLAIVLECFDRGVNVESEDVTAGVTPLFYTGAGSQSSIKKTVSAIVEFVSGGTVRLR